MQAAFSLCFELVFFISLFLFFLIFPCSKHPIVVAVRHQGQHGRNGGSRQTLQTWECRSLVSAQTRREKQVP